MSADTAALIRDVRQPQRVPEWVRSRPAQLRERWIAALILDGLLEVEGAEGFVSGPTAYQFLVGAELAHPTGARTVELSVNALKYGQQFGISDPDALARRLYRFHSLPASPRWLRRVPSSAALYERLELELGRGKSRRGQWVRVDPRHEAAGWMVWERPERRAERRFSDVRFKLYVSPGPAYFVDHIATISDALADSEARVLKFGGTAYGLLRPDKLVAYFPSEESMRSAGKLVVEALPNVLAHGVPFTASLTTDGLVSWGVDLGSDTGDAVEANESWRSWVTRKLATALIVARSDAAAEVEPWKFALTRLSLEGIDIDTFAPTDSGWRGEPVV